MTMEISHPVNDLPFFFADLSRRKVSLDPDIMVAGEDPQGDVVAQRIKNAGELEVFLPGDPGNAVLDITEEDKRIRIGILHQPQEPCEP